MKSVIFLLFGCLLTVLFLSCSAYVEPGYKDGVFIVNESGGRLPLSEFLQVQKQEELLLTTKELNKQRQLASSQKNLRSIQRLNYIDTAHNAYYRDKSFQDLSNIIGLSEASAYVTISHDTAGNIKFEDSGGRMSPMQFRYLKNLEESINDFKATERQLRQYLIEQDFSFAYKLLVINSKTLSINDPANPRSPDSEIVFLSIKNSSSRIITLTSGPFKNYSISPKDSTDEEKPFWTGYYDLQYTVMKVDGSQNPDDKKIARKRWSKQEFINVSEDGVVNIY